MKVSKELTTVTPFSKFLALILFILFPVVGFYVGVKYEQAVVQTQDSKQSQPLFTTPSHVVTTQYKECTWIRNSCEVLDMRSGSCLPDCANSGPGYVPPPSGMRCGFQTVTHGYTCILIPRK